MRVSARRFAAALAGALAIAAIGTGSVWAQDDELPDTAGKAELVEVCTQCHAAGLITQRNRTSDEWSEIMIRMKGLGAMMDDEKQDAILAYLNENLGKQSASAAATAAAPATGAAQNKQH